MQNESENKEAVSKEGREHRTHMKQVADSPGMEDALMDPKRGTSHRTEALQLSF